MNKKIKKDVNLPGFKTARIAYTISMVRGMEPFVHREIQAMKDNGLEIILFITKYKKDPIYGPKINWTYYTINIWTFIYHFIITTFRKFYLLPSLINIAFQKSSFLDLFIAIYFSNIMRKIKIDKIHCHFGDHKLFIGFFCSKLLNIPLSVTIHAHGLYANPNTKMFRLAINQCDKIVTIAQKNKDILVKEFGVDEKKISIIRLYAANHFFEDRNKIRVLTVGRFTPRKGFDDLIKTIKLINRDDVEFVIAGFGPLNLKKMIRDYGMENRVTIYDRLDERQLKVLYHSCHIYCLPSKTVEGEGQEGIPVVLMEAMASGMAVVATKNGATAEIVKHTLVDEGSPKKLAEAIIYYLENRDLITKHGIMNIEIAKKNYSSNNIHKLYRFHLS